MCSTHHSAIDDVFDEERSCCGDSTAEDGDDVAVGGPVYLPGHVTECDGGDQNNRRSARGDIESIGGDILERLPRLEVSVVD